MGRKYISMGYHWDNCQIYICCKRRSSRRTQERS